MMVHIPLTHSKQILGNPWGIPRDWLIVEKLGPWESLGNSPVIDWLWKNWWLTDCKPKPEVRQFYVSQPDYRNDVNTEATARRKVFSHENKCAPHVAVIVRMCNKVPQIKAAYI